MHKNSPAVIQETKQTSSINMYSWKGTLQYMLDAPNVTGPETLSGMSLFSFPLLINLWIIFMTASTKCKTKCPSQFPDPR